MNGYDSAGKEVSFKDYLFNNSTNRKILWMAATVSVTLISVFKYFYPFANYIHDDSFTYLDAANENLNINFYLIGYSNFLRLFSVFTTSDLVLTTFQYLFIQTSALFLLFTMFYFYRTGKIIQWVLLCFTVFNPLSLYLGNLISSDAIFLALSLTWFNLLLWIMHKPTLGLIWWHTAIIYTAFITRHNALIYIIISTSAFILSQQDIRRKLLGITSSILVISLCIAYTGSQYKQLTGKWQYSPFAGWQMANNAMYAFRYVDSAIRKPVPQRFYSLDKMVRQYFDTTRNVFQHPTEVLMANTYYMWMSPSPLCIYANQPFQTKSHREGLNKWALVGPLYNDYGQYLIKQYPFHFAKYFLWPNANKYFAPPLEFLDPYNFGRDTVTSLAKEWFRYTSNKITTRTNNYRITTLNFYPILSGAINILMLFGLVFFTLLNGFRREKLFGKGIFLAGMFWILNATFTIFASSAALRFQAFPIILAIISVALLVDWLWKMASSSESQELNPDINYLKKETLPL